MSHKSKDRKPPFRKLRGYAFDPSLSNKIDTAFINDIVYKVNWEDDLKPGPVGEYLEVIDYDPTVEKYYTPVDLNERYILAQDGLDPSESNPQFHQQMVYAVAMTTIKNFEKALGRPILWNPRKFNFNRTEEEKEVQPGTQGYRYPNEYVPKLRIYPHAFRDANAYYSPQKRALLFGYFSSQPADPTIQMPDSLIFTCLSHDIIAHETTHAILDGIYKLYTHDTNPDMLAFHEAFADIVALFQHFTFPEVLKNQISKTKGDLASQNILGELAQEFGSAIGGYGALRSAIGYIDEKTKEWKPKIPNGDEYQKIFEPHQRGAILVSAVFDAFLTIYKDRVADLLRIASGGTGILAQGELHPDLVNRLAAEASKTAGHILQMCIRALDYCPPVDITFGDYMRAIITADSEIVSDDSKNYRLAFIEAFRKRGIYPEGIRSLSVESLCYSENSESELDRTFSILTKFLRQYSIEISNAGSQDIVGNLVKVIDTNTFTTIKVKNNAEVEHAREKIFNITRDYIIGSYTNPKHIIYGLHRRIFNKFKNAPQFQRISGLVFMDNWEDLGIRTKLADNQRGPYFWIDSLRLASRVGPSGNKSNQIILSLTQETGISIKTDSKESPVIEFFVPEEGIPDTRDRFVMTGGVTLIFDLDTLRLKYCISKPIIDPKSINRRGYAGINVKQAIKLYDYYNSADESQFHAYFSPGRHTNAYETFSFLHNS